jgi:hypothetical protein
VLDFDEFNADVAQHMLVESRQVLPIPVPALPDDQGGRYRRDDGAERMKDASERADLL